jgi:hypothetical protein
MKKIAYKFWSEEKRILAKRNILDFLPNFIFFLHFVSIQDSTKFFLGINTNNNVVYSCICQYTNIC